MAKQKKSFVPKARLIQILGEYLIKDATVGLLELIKNSYDADATAVSVEMHNLNKKTAKIIIRDNGSGMDDDTFLNKWMNPATGHKEKQKEGKNRSALGRLPLGEKGVGRFATQQIGDNLKMISKTKTSAEELVAEVDWTLFEDSEEDLSKVEIEYYKQKPEFFSSTQNQSGTVLEITGLKSAWGLDEIDRISEALKRMKSPFKGANDFDINLKFIDCPEEFSEYENLDLGDILDIAHYKFVGLVDENGILTFEYEFNVPGETPTHKEGTVDLLKESSVQAKKPLSCGGFFIRLYNYYLEKNLKWLKRTNVKNAEILIRELKGISIYRDGIRVLPYGEQGNDWLELDKRKRERGEKRKIDNRTTIGFIEIDQINNLILKDKTNREGFIESEEFLLFHDLIFASILVFENERLDDVPDVVKKKEEPPMEIVDKSVNTAISKLDEVISTLAESDDANVRNAASQIQPIRFSIEGIKNQVATTVEEYETINKQLFNLAGTGLAAERFTHEFARLVSGANSSLVRLKKTIELVSARISPEKYAKINKEIDTIGGALEALRNDIRLLGPMFYIKRVASDKELNIRQIIDNTLLLQENAIKKEGIDVEVEGETFSVTMREGSCMQIFNNLIDNSVYWLSRKSENDDKKIKIILDYKTNSVFVSDSGPGVVSRYRDKIFEPFFSMKGEDGRGLGLYIIKEILQEKNWDIILVNQEDFSGLLKGASFKIIFTTSKD